MKKTFLALTMLLAVLVITSSCGGGGKSDSAKGDGEESALTLKPSTTKVQGALGEFFEVVEKDYKVKKDGSLSTVYVELTCLKDMESLLNIGEQFASSKDEKGLYIELNMELRDKDDNVISKETIWGTEDLASLKPGDKGSVYASWFEGEPTHFTITSSVKHNDGKDSDKNDASKELDELNEAINKELETVDKALGILDDAAKLVR